MREKCLGFIFWLVILTCYSHSTSDAEEDVKNRQTFVIRYKDGEQTIPVTVVLDYKKQTEYVINMNPRTPAKSVTLYDFKQRTIAYKDLTNRECFLGRLTHETLSEESSALQDVKNPVEVRPKVRSLDPKMPALTPTEIRNIAGQKTAAFCRKMNTWLLMPEKSRRISKREADEIEERTLHYQGHRTTHYSHHERETRRRFRNRSQPNHRRRSRNRQSAAGRENGSFENSEPTTFPHYLNGLSPKGDNINTDHLGNIIETSQQNHTYNLQPSHNSYFLNRGNGLLEVGERREDAQNEDTAGDRTLSSNFDYSNHYRYPESENERPSPNSVPLHSKQRDFGGNDPERISALPFNAKADSSKNIDEGSILAKLTGPDSENEIELKITTTESTLIPYQQGTGYPNVHSSLAHLLPIYKPLGQEFDVGQETRNENQENNQIPYQQRDNLEIEGDPSNPTLPEHNKNFVHLTDVYNTSHDPDVSVSVLEAPRITKEFENIGNNGSPASKPKDSRSFSTVVESYPSSIQTTDNDSSYYNRANPHIARNTPVERIYPSSDNNLNSVLVSKNSTYPPLPEVQVTTVLPIQPTRKYFLPQRTTPDNLYVPSVHTAFQNSEDFNSFQIFPNYIESNIVPIPAERNSTFIPFRDRKNSYVNTVAGPQDLVLTTEYPLTEVKHDTEINHRSDIPSEESSNQLPPDLLQPSVQNQPLHTSNKTPEGVSPRKIRYQTALRDFKPDEILIDIENVPTHTPPPVTASFRQRIPTTIEPTTRSLATESVRSDADRRSEQSSGTTWRAFVPTTRFPRRRINDKTRRPFQSGPVHFAQRNSFNRNRHRLPSLQVNPLVGVSHASSPYHTNNRQFHYPKQPVPPPHLRMPSEMNQIPPIGTLTNLPPGVSVHPRHPQAPFADMVHSNRPPTMPVLTANQDHLKPHRQRHHRKKDRHPNSCCRLRGKAGAFQSCCRNGGPCCSSSYRRMQQPGVPCCSSSSANGRVIPSNQIQPPVRTSNNIAPPPPIRTEKAHRRAVDNKDGCQKEKMCRTLYESTQQVMVCRNAHIEGC